MNVRDRFFSLQSWFKVVYENLDASAYLLQNSQLMTALKRAAGLSTKADVDAFGPLLRDALLPAPAALQKSNSKRLIPHYEHVVSLARLTANRPRSRLVTAAVLKAGPDEEEGRSLYALAGESSLVPEKSKLLFSVVSADNANVGPATPIAGVGGTGLGYGGIDCQNSRDSCAPTAIDGSTEFCGSIVQIPEMTLELRGSKSVPRL